MRRMTCLFVMIAAFVSWASFANSQDTSSQSGTVLTNTLNVNGSLGFVGINDELPANATLVNKGEVVKVNQDDHTVSVRDANSGVINVYSIPNKQMLDSVTQGDSIKIFSQAGPQQ